MFPVPGWEEVTLIWIQFLSQAPRLSTAYSLILSPDPGLRPAPGQAGWYGGDSALALNPVFTQRHLAGQQWNLEGKLVMPLMPTKLVGTA